MLTLNSERYIERCLQSLFHQSLQVFEAIIVDAGSQDGTLEIVSRFDERFHWLELPASDMGAARNYGMRMSKGRYITFLDSDDFYLKDKLRRDVAELESNPAIEVTFCTAWHFRTGRPGRMARKRSGMQPRVLKDFFAGRNHNLNTMCIRRSVWDAGFSFGEGDRGRYGEEWRLQLLLAHRGVPMSFRAEPLVVAEMRPDSHTLWSRQWIMKTQAIAEVEYVSGLLTAEQRSEVDVEAVIDDLRGKLLVALLLDRRKDEAWRIVSEIRDRRRARRARLLATVARAVPRGLLRVLLRELWLWRQNRSFEWQPTPVGLRDEVSALRGER